MFVDETRDHQRVRRNEATRLYRANWLKRHPKDDPESLPYIAGAAAVFEERVWSNWIFQRSPNLRRHIQMSPGSQLDAIGPYDAPG
jgi:hypothetical protein